MSQEYLGANYLPFQFQGSRSLSNSSVQITGLQKIGEMKITAGGSIAYVGLQGVGANGFPLYTGQYLDLKASDLSKYYISGAGTVNFIGSYA